MQYSKQSNYHTVSEFVKTASLKTEVNHTKRNELKYSQSGICHLCSQLHVLIQIRFKLMKKNSEVAMKEILCP